MPLDPACLGFVLATTACTDSSELLRRGVGAFGLEDSGLRLDHLAERPEGHAFAVRKRAAVAPEHEAELARLDRLEELEDEPALADPRDADEREELRTSPRA